MVNQPAFPAQQDMYALHTVTDAGFRYFPYPLRDGAVITPQPDTAGLQQIKSPRFR